MIYRCVHTLKNHILIHDQSWKSVHSKCVKATQTSKSNRYIVHLYQHMCVCVQLCTYTYYI